MSDIDWTFKSAKTTHLSHGFHPYPSRMVPAIAATLLKLYNPEKNIVLDPFCGSGGVLVESILHGSPSIGIDINPLACLLAKVKTTPLNPIDLYQKWGLLFKKILDRFEAIPDEIQNAINVMDNKSVPENIRNIFYLF